MIKVIKRPIQSFVRRQGRMRVKQREAYVTGWSHYGLLDPGQVQAYLAQWVNKPVLIEIGFGMGDTLLHAAQQGDTDRLILGIDVHIPGIGAVLSALSGLSESVTSRVRLIKEDAAIVCDTWLPPTCCDRIRLFFPDPWPKKRHQKRRLIQSEQVAAWYRLLKPQGVFHLATDSQDYAIHALHVFNHAQGFYLHRAQCTQVDSYPYRPCSKFSRRAQQAGTPIWDLEWIKDP